MCIVFCIWWARSTTALSPPPSPPQVIPRLFVLVSVLFLFVCICICVGLYLYLYLYWFVFLSVCSSIVLFSLVTSPGDTSSSASVLPSLKLSDTKIYGPKYEPSSKPLNISVIQTLTVFVSVFPSNVSVFGYHYCGPHELAGFVCVLCFVSRGLLLYCLCLAWPPSCHPPLSGCVGALRHSTPDTAVEITLPLIQQWKADWPATAASALGRMFYTYISGYIRAYSYAYTYMICMYVYVDMYM